MLKQTFIQIPGMGKVTERELWEQGIDTSKGRRACKPGSGFQHKSTDTFVSCTAFTQETEPEALVLVKLLCRIEPLTSHLQRLVIR